MLHIRLRRNAAWLLIPALLAGCDTDTITSSLEEVSVYRAAVVLNRGDRTVSVIPFDNAAAPRSLALPAPPQAAGVSSMAAGVPTDLAVSGERALISAGTAVSVVDLVTGATERTILLGVSDARGAAFLRDTTAVVASPASGVLIAFNPATGRVAAPSTEGGAQPVELLSTGDRLYVLNAAADGGGLTVVDAALRRLGSVRLRGTAPRAMVLRGTLMYVLHGGGAGMAGGALSVVDVERMLEVDFVPGLGESPESLAFNARGELLITLPGRGVMMYATTPRALVHGPESPLSASGLSGVTRVASDPAGFVYALQPGGCAAPGMLMRLGADGLPVASAATGPCPVDLEFTSLSRR